MKHLLRLQLKEVPTYLPGSTKESYRAHQKRIAIIARLAASGQLPPERIDKMVDDAVATDYLAQPELQGMT